MRINSISPNYNINNNFVPKKQNNNSKVQSFKGNTVPEPVVNGLAKAYSWVADRNLFSKGIEWFSKSNKTFTHLLVAESCLLSGFYMINTLRNDKIKKEQKPQMIINDALTLGVSTAGAYLVEDKITDVVMKGAEKYIANHKDFYKGLAKEAMAKAESTPKNELLNKVGEVIKNGNLASGLDDVAEMIGTHLKGIVTENGGKSKAFGITKDKLQEIQTAVKDTVTNNSGSIEKAKEAVSGIVDDVYTSSAARAQADKILPGINKLKVLVIFGIIYRYLGPVVITPIANKISSKWFDKKTDKAESAQDKK